MTASSAEPILRASGLACGYAGKPVLSGVDLSLAPGEVVVLLGPNGSGKSTLLRTLVGALAPMAGRVELAGRALGDHGAREVARRIAYVPQDERPQFAFTVGELVRMGRHPFADGLMDSAADVAAGEAAMRRAGCLELAERSVLELSGGELQRALIARAFAQSPKLLLMDEPTSHLDVHHALELSTTLREMAGEGLCVLAAVHDLNLASTMGSRAVVLDRGGVALAGPMREVLADEALDRAFGVRFERIEVDARTVLVPRPITSS